MGTIDTGDTTWMLISSAIVMFMFVPGLALFYGGMVSSRNVLSTMMYSLSSMLVVSLVWVLWAYTLAFGTDVNGLIGGLDFFGFKGVGADPMGSMTIPHLIFAIFQCLFAAITVALISELGNRANPVICLGALLHPLGNGCVRADGSLDLGRRLADEDGWTRLCRAGGCTYPVRRECPGCSHDDWTS